MTVPSNNLYDFIHQVTEKQYWLIRSYPWGSRELCDFGDYQIDLDGPNGIPKSLRTIHQLSPNPLTQFPYYKQVRNFQPILLCHDQEPLDFDLYQDGSEVMQRFSQSHAYDTEIPHPDFNLRNLIVWSWQEKWTLLHSELNSPELSKYESTGRYIGAYWWSHAIISLDWYRYAQWDQSLQYNNPQKLFLVYARELTGTRKYRGDFLDMINSISAHCQIGSVDGQPVSSESSASYNSRDLNDTAFSVVLETLFDDARIHLTEKVLRPIACGHPFILAAGAGSLSLLRKYGFETYGPWINESYDDIQDSKARLQAIVREMQRISQLSTDQQHHVVECCRAVAKRNQKRFFDPDFFNTIVNELKENVSQAWKKHQGRLSPEFSWKSLRWRRKNIPEYFTPEVKQNLSKTLPLIRKLRQST